MRKNQFLSNLLATTIICGAASVATPAFAQGDQPQAGPAEATQTEPDDQGQEVVITGSRIPAPPNLTAVSPVTVVNSQEIRLQGTTRTEDLINSLPQSFGGQGGNIANGASGTATVNLRGLGSNRTLVLINGRRLVPGDPAVPVADINVIPSSLVSRIDVLTGGASSVYGSDAVAGVVNFIMDTELQGVRLDAQYSFYQHNNRNGSGIVAALDGRGFPYPTGSVADGGTYDLSMAIGTAFDDNRGHIVAYAGYRRLNAVTQGRRDYSSCASQARTPAQAAANPPGGTAGAPLFFCGGSATSRNGTIIAFDGGTSTFFQIGPNRTLIPGFTPYNFAPTNYFQRPDERYTLGAFASYEIAPALQPYLEVMFMDDRTVAQIAPSGDFGNTTTINCGPPGAPTVNAPGVGNPLLSAQQRSILCDAENLVDANGAANTGNPPRVFIDPTTGLPYTRGFAQILRRNVEGGGRRDDLQHTNYRIVAGMRGDLSDVWAYDIYYQFARTNFAETYTNDFSVTRLTRAIDIIDDPRTVGVVDPICRSVLDGTDPSCVPWDIFATGQVSDAALAYLQTPGLQRGNVDQTVASASLTGNLGTWGIQFPWAQEGVGIALGVEYRKEFLQLQPDSAFSALPSSDLAGQGAPTLFSTGEFDVREAFVEVRVPIVDDNFFHYLGLEAGYRYSDYGVAGRSFSTDTYKIGLDFSPIRDIRFRAAYNRAVRAPNIQELFAPQRVALNGNSDPCAGAAPSASLAACQAMGVSAAQYGTIAGNPAGQYNGLIGGNPNLAPEIADTITVGIVIQPSFIPHLAITVDWFDIKIDAPIQPIGQDVILDVCANTLDPTFCGLVRRDQFGSLWRTGAGFVIDQPQNIGSFRTRGIDLGVGYSMELGGAGGLSFNLVATWLDRLITDNGVSAPYDCAGLYGLICTTPNPEWRHKARLTYTHPSGVGLSAQWRYFSGVGLDRADSSQPVLSEGPTGAPLAFAPFNERIPSQSYFDLTLTARIGDHYNFRLGVNNILDREPPIVGANGTSAVINACTGVFCSGNTFPNVYDAMGRYIFAGVSLDF